MSYKASFFFFYCIPLINIPLFIHSTVVGHLFPGFGYYDLHCEHSYMSFGGHKPITSTEYVPNSETAGS